jgi:hypothetical protein
MFRPFEASSPEVQVDGRTILAVVNGIMIRSVANELLAREGLSAIQPEAWYSQQAWLNVYRRIAEKLGSDALFAIGTRIPYYAEFPTERMRDVPTALQAIDHAYHTAHRGGEIGVYAYSQPEPGIHELRCANPYPCDFDMGIIHSLIERFRGSQQYMLEHVAGSCRKRGDAECRYRVRRLPR